MIVSIAYPRCWTSTQFYNMVKICKEDTTRNNLYPQYTFGVEMRLNSRLGDFARQVYEKTNN